MRRPFRIRDRHGWAAEVEHPDGRLERKQFPTYREAEDWLRDAAATVAAAFEPALGGPAKVHLAGMLSEYARLYTVNKHGWDSELTRINHYRAGAGLPPLKLARSEEGHRSLEEMPRRELPEGFARHRNGRLAQRRRTYATIEGLGATTVSRITPRHVQELVSTMRAEGLSESTIQKEIALLRHAFNEAIRCWSWSLLRNPCSGIRIGGSNRRFVVLTEDQQDRLVAALAECDNPQVWPLCELAIASLLRRGSLLQLRWSQIDLEHAMTQVWTKGIVSRIPLSPRSIEVLRRMHAVRRPNEDRVFTITPNALQMAWEGVREKAGLSALQFRDLRHVGATFYARFLNAHELRQALGHRTTWMAEVYVNIARNDVGRALALAEERAAAPRPLPRAQLPEGLRKLPRRRGAPEAPDAAQPAAPESAGSKGTPCDMDSPLPGNVLRFPGRRRP
jgi:integrase